MVMEDGLIEVADISVLSKFDVLDVDAYRLVKVGEYFLVQSWNDHIGPNGGWEKPEDDGPHEFTKIDEAIACFKDYLENCLIEIKPIHLDVPPED